MLVSCVFGVVDEQDSLIDTVNTLLQVENLNVFIEIIIVIAPFASGKS